MLRPCIHDVGRRPEFQVQVNPTNVTLLAVQNGGSSFAPLPTLDKLDTALFASESVDRLFDYELLELRVRDPAHLLSEVALKGSQDLTAINQVCSTDNLGDLWSL